MDSEEPKENGVAAPTYLADLLPNMIPYLDRHLIFPLVADRKRTTEMVKFMYALLKPTYMTDYVGRLHKEMDNLDEAPPQYEQMREEVLKKKKVVEEKTAKIREVLGNEEIVGNLRSDKIANMNYLKEFGVTEEMVADLWEYGQFHYNCGNYQEAGQALEEFRVLSTDNDKVPAAVWGRLACAILCTEWELALEEITKVKENIDQRLFNNPYSQLESRTWLIHWSLFPLFNNDVARDQLLELLFSPSYINTVQTLCPWILRYLAAAVISNRTRTRNSNTYQKQLKDLIKIVRQEAYEYADPVTDFVKALYVDFDFEAAQKCMSASEELLENDFFLTSSTDAFVESARHLISEVYCKIHQRIDIRDLSTRLGLSESEGEKWIVNLIRETRVDAKIDYKAGTVEMNHPPQSVYQQVIERTKGAFFRTQVLSSAVAK